MSRPPADIDPRAIAVEFFKRLGGMAGMTKWGRTHRSLAYQLISKLLAQPLVQTNVSINNVRDDGEARRKLEDALMRIVESRKYADVDPAVIVDGERLTIEHDPQPAVPRLMTPVPAPGSNSENLTSPKQGPLFDGSRASSAPAAGKKNPSMYSNLPGLEAGVALDQNADDKLSTTERFLLWKGHGGPP